MDDYCSMIDEINDFLRGRLRNMKEPDTLPPVMVAMDRKASLPIEWLAMYGPVPDCDRTPLLDDEEDDA